MMEMSKGLKMMLGMFGITPEMMANPNLLLQQFGITPEMLANPNLLLQQFGVNPNLLLQQFGVNPDDIIKKVAEIQQIGVRIDAAFRENSVRLARIEKHLGIDTTNGSGADDGANGELGDMETVTPDRRN